jgi:hypothetical protein
VEKSAAWRTRNRGKEIREQQDDAGDTE